MTVPTVAILGAGAMGSALATPAAAAGNRVRLWGTWLDDDLLAELRSGRPHPRTGVRIGPRVALHAAGELAAALDGADLVAVAISSEGVLEVARRAAATLAPGTPRGSHDARGTVTYFYCSKREGWCRKGTAEVAFPIAVP